MKRVYQYEDEPPSTCPVCQQPTTWRPLPDRQCPDLRLCRWACGCRAVCLVQAVYELRPVPDYCREYIGAQPMALDYFRYYRYMPADLLPPLHCTACHQKAGWVEASANVPLTRTGHTQARQYTCRRCGHVLYRVLDVHSPEYQRDPRWEGLNELTASLTYKRSFRDDIAAAHRVQRQPVFEGR